MRERCHRCYTVLTSEDKYWYSISCEECQCDLEWEEHEKNLAIKSAYWRWRAVCFGVRFMCGIAGAGRDVLLHKLRRQSGKRRSEFRHDRRK